MDNKSSKTTPNEPTQNEKITKWLTEKKETDDDCNYYKTKVKELKTALRMAIKQNEEKDLKIEEMADQIQILTEQNKHLSRLAEEGAKLKDLIHEYI